MNKKIIVDLDNKLISIRNARINNALTVKELYSYLMDLFDEPENMRYEIPITALGKNKFELINGWKVDPSSKKFLRGVLK